MTMTEQMILKIELRYESDVVLARQRARQIAALLDFDAQGQVRIATIVSEMARNAFRYAGGGRVSFCFTPGSTPKFTIVIEDQGKGIADLDAVLSGRYVSNTGMGLGIIGAKRLMDDFAIESGTGGTRVVMAKYLPPTARKIDAQRLTALTSELMQKNSNNPMDEMQQQNQELLAALSEVQAHRHRLFQLNQELEETNRGVVALYAELDERADYLRRASDLKTEFFSNMTHEFRTPLNSILSISQIVLDRLDGELTDEQEKQVNYIRRAANDLSGLVNDLLDLAKVEAGKMTVRVSEFNVPDMFGTLRGMLKPLLESNNSVSLVFEETDNLPQLLTDEGKVSQILRNFISNGLKYTHKGEVRVSAQSNIPGFISFMVTDTGIGIAPENKERIFKEFVQIETAQQKNIKGTGLGLPLSKKLATLLGGYVTVDSIPGSGSTFSAIVPIQYDSDESKAQKLLHPEARHTRIILIIDDNETDRYVLKKMLNHPGVHTIEASDGSEGLELAKSMQPELIFLDLVMPGMNGFDVLKRLKESEKTRHIPVVIHTSKTLSQTELNLLESGTVAIVSKATENRADSLSTIKRLLDSSAPQPMP